MFYNYTVLRVPKKDLNYKEFPEYDFFLKICPETKYQLQQVCLIAPIEFRCFLQFHFFLSFQKMNKPSLIFHKYQPIHPLNPLHPQLALILKRPHGVLQQRLLDTICTMTELKSKGISNISFSFICYMEESL